MLGNILGGLIGGIGSWLGGKQSSEAAERMNAANIAMQREFAQHGIRWKVADSLAAGVHPLFGLGAQTHAFSNVSGDVGAAGRGLAEAGQSIGRAVQASASQAERTAAALSLEKMRLENDLLKTKLWSDVRRVRAGIGPPMPATAGPQIPGTTIGLEASGDVPQVVKMEPQEVQPTTTIGVSPGMNPSTQYLRLPGGNRMQVMSQPAHDATEDTPSAWQLWAGQHLPPWMGGTLRKPADDVHGKEWFFVPTLGTWVHRDLGSWDRWLPPMRRGVVEPYSTFRSRFGRWP